MKRILLSILVASLLVLPACDSGNPVAPAAPAVAAGDAQFTVSLSANPPRVNAGSGVPSVLTVTVTEGGTAPADGTMVTLNTDLGDFGEDGEGNRTMLIMVGLVGGTAQANLFPSADAGTATVLATIGASSGSIEVVFVDEEPSGPFLQAVTPNTGDPAGGEMVDLVGGGFVEPVRVSFGNALALVVATSSGRITVETPPSPTPVGVGRSLVVDVSVTSGLNQPEPQVANLPGSFTYVDSSAAFFLAEVVPNRGPPEGGGDPVEIRGGGFVAPVRVEFGGKTAIMPMVKEDGTVIEVIVPSSPMPVPAGESLVVDVTVFNALDRPDPSMATLMGGYTYRVGADTPPPAVISVAPSEGRNDEQTLVTILGEDFADPAQVFFGALEAGSVMVESSVRITASAPAATGTANENQTVDVTVRNTESGLEGTLPGGFTYGSLAIAITAIDPSRGPYMGGTTVTVTGREFPVTGAISVELAGIRQLEETVITDTTLQFVTAGISLGMCPGDGQLPQTGLTVTDNQTGEMGSADLTFTYTVTMPIMSRVTPTFGPQLGNTIVSIQGTGFEEPVRVVFAKDDEEFTASVQSVSEMGDLIRVSSPRVPDGFFAEADCVLTDGSPGKRLVEVTADVRVTNLDTGCTDTFANAYTYAPTDPSCRAVPPP